MAVNLVNLGQSTFGIVGSVALSALYTNPYTRAVPPYRVNPFSIANGNGPSEFSAPYALVADWDGYTHSTLNLGDNLEDTIGYGGQFTLSWDAPTGYNSNVCRYRVSVKSAGGTPDTSVDPLVSPTTQFFTTSTSALVSGLTVGNWYGAVVQVEFDDGNTAILGVGFPGSVSTTELTGSSQGILTSEELPPNAPVLGAVTQFPDSEDCEDPINDGLFVTVSIDSAGPSTMTIEYRINGGSWNTGSSGLSAGTSTYSLSASEGSYGNADNVEFRARYNSVSGPVWSSTSDLTVFCGPL